MRRVTGLRDNEAVKSVAVQVSQQAAGNVGEGWGSENDGESRRSLSCRVGR